MVEQGGLGNGSPPARPVQGQGRGGRLGAKPPEAIIIIMHNFLKWPK